MMVGIESHNSIHVSVPVRLNVPAQRRPPIPLCAFVEDGAGNAMMFKH